MTPFNIPRKQLRLTNWMPSLQKRKYLRKLRKSICKDCWMGFKPFEVEWDKIEEGDETKARCKYCKQCLAKNCCKDCGRDYGKSTQFDISEDYCGYCAYLNKWGPCGWEYEDLKERLEEEERYEQMEKKYRNDY